jgi:hypothetical protein
MKPHARPGFSFGGCGAFLKNRYITDYLFFGRLDVLMKNSSRYITMTSEQHKTPATDLNGLRWSPGRAEGDGICAPHPERE